MPLHPSHLHFNPRSPCGERRLPEIKAEDTATFQSTLPLRGATGRGRVAGVIRAFQSTLPLRGATTASALDKSSSPISIHAPLAGSDSAAVSTPTTKPPFQSTLPLRGATTPFFPCRQSRADFNPRSPCGERLDRLMSLTSANAISIHAPLAGSDQRRRRRP